jgi:hypothetical protein
MANAGPARDCLHRGDGGARRRARGARLCL